MSLKDSIHNLVLFKGWCHIEQNSIPFINMSELFVDTFKGMVDLRREVLSGDFKDKADMDIVSLTSHFEQGHIFIQRLDWSTLILEFVIVDFLYVQDWNPILSQFGNYSR